MTDYNYARFPLDMDMADFVRFRDVAPVGTKAPDGRLVDARDGGELALSELWRSSGLVLEFGSIT